MPTLLPLQRHALWWPGRPAYRPNQQDPDASRPQAGLWGLDCAASLPADARLRVVLNPASAGGRGRRRLPQLQTLLAQHGFEPDIVCTEGPAHATVLAHAARSDGVDLLAVAGGDGTLSEVVQAFVDSDGQPLPGPALTVLPLGTGGDFCRSVGISARLPEAIAALRTGRIKPIDVIALCLHGQSPPLSRLFVNVAGPGIGGLADELVAAGPKWLGGRASYALAALRLLWTFEPPIVRVVTDNQLFFEGPVMSVCLANGQYLGGGIHIAPGARVDDGLIDVVVVEARPMLPAAALTIPLFTGTHLRWPGMHVVRAREVRLEHVGGARAVLDVDGEALQGLPATARVVPGAVRWLSPMPKVAGLLAAVMAFVALAGWPAVAQAFEATDRATPTAAAAPRAAPIAVDGRLNDPDWRDASWHSAFAERKPGLGAVPPVQTRFAVRYDATNLYLAVFCAEPDAANITARSTARDSWAIFSDDAISIKIDPLHDERTTVGFVLNPAGARLDYRGVNETNMRREWDAVWTGAAAIVPGGWSAEFCLPWTALGIDPAAPPALVGLNLSRDHARRNATYDWALMPPPFSPVSASRYGHLTGLAALAGLPGDASATTAAASGGEAGLVVVPWVLGAAQGAVNSSAAETRWDAGGDVTFRRGQLRAQATLNTDFAQADVDDAVVNLDRFSLQMPEKRDFFLRDVERFTLGRSDAVQALYSRRIGLDRGQRVPIVAGVKVVGEPSDALQLSALNVVTRRAGALPWTSHTALRGQWQLDGGSNVGAMVTQRQSAADWQDSNTVVGVDGALRGGRRPLLLEAFALASHTGARAGAGTEDVGAATGSALGNARMGGGAGISASWRGLLWRPTLRWLWTDRGLRTDLGYLRRVGVQEADASLVHEPRFARFGLERLRLEAKAGAVYRANHRSASVLDSRAAARFDLVWNSGWWVGAEYGVLQERVLADFDAAGTTVAAGSYAMQRLAVLLETPAVRTLYAWAELESRDYFGGWARGATWGLTFRPGTWLRLEASGTNRLIELGNAAQWVAVANGRAAIGFSPDLNLDLYGGLDYQRNRIPLMARLRWTFLPGSDLFVVGNATLADPATDYSAIVKVALALL